MKYIFLLILVFAFEAHSMCDPWPLEIEQYYANSDEAILVEVTSAWNIEEHDFKAKYVVMESYKGESKVGDIGEADYQREPHSILLTPGKYYLLFFKGSQHVSICLGSRAINVDISALQRLRKIVSRK